MGMSGRSRWPQRKEQGKDLQHLCILSSLAFCRPKERINVNHCSLSSLV
jgi:hypothetical protein